MKLRSVVIAFLLLVPAASFAADKQLEGIQRDVALMQEDVRQLQRSFDQQIAILKTLTQQAVDNTTRISTSVGVVQTTLPTEVKRQVDSALAPVAGLNTRLDQVSSQVQTLAEAMQALNASMQQVHSQLADLKNVVSAIQAAPAPPPNASATPQVPLDVLYQNAVRDMSGSKPDLALSEFADCVKWYHDDPQAASCLYYSGMIRYSRQEFDQAVQQFDAVLDQFPKSDRAAGAYFYKGLALLKMGQTADARKQFLAVIQQFPKAAEADRAREQMRALGPNTPAKKK